MKRLSIALGITLFGALVYLLGWSSIFSVSSIDVVGAPTAQASQRVKAVAAITPGDQLARIDQRAIQAKLAPLTWIEHVDISRNWLSKKVTIAITARTPVARMNSLFLARDGRTFSLPGGTMRDIPTVIASTPAAGVAAARLFTALPQDFTKNVLTMRAGVASFTFTLATDRGPLQIQWGSDSDNELKLRVMKALLAAPENKAISRIDLSAPHAPIVK